MIVGFDGVLEVVRIIGASESVPYDGDIIKEMSAVIRVPSIVPENDRRIDLMVQVGHFLDIAEEAGYIENIDESRFRLTLDGELLYRAIEYGMSRSA